MFDGETENDGLSFLEPGFPKTQALLKQAEQTIPVQGWEHGASAQWSPFPHSEWNATHTRQVERVKDPRNKEKIGQ